MARTSYENAHDVSGYGWIWNVLMATLLVGVLLGGAAETLKAQKASSLPADPQPPRLDLLPKDAQPARLDLHTTTPVVPTIPQDYLISPDDELFVDVMDVAELTRGYRVSPKGEITIPLLSDPVQAEGLTLAELAQTLSDKLQAAGMVSHPHVTVQVSSSRLHAVSIAGAVKKPQMYEFFGKTTVLDALSQAEGLDTEAGTTAIITRGELGSKMAATDATASLSGAASTLTNSGTIKVDLKRLLEDGDATQNYELYPGDRLTVQRAGVVYVVGAVNKPGGFVLKDDQQQMTILKALALAEYTKSIAAMNRTVIVRQFPGGTQEIPIDLQKILERRVRDRVLLANDILFIPESSAKRTINRAAEAVAQGAVVLLYRVP